MPSAPLPLLDNSPVFSVSTLSAAVRRTMEDAFGFVRVRGEVTNCRAVGSSGHLYFDLKDEQAVLKVVCWRTQVPKLAHRPENGLEMVCHGRLTTYQGQSTYQLSLEQAELAGQGAMLALLEQRRQKLTAEGLFDAARKKPLPFLPRCIGVVTSPTGAVIRDILHRISERFPVPVLLWPVPVQGQGAAEAIAAAIAGFDAMAASHRPDVLIVARGGGSLEDLWCFNEEIVVRAAAACSIPLISAVGHETDTTLIDFAADRRAPTPTAAAEMAVPVREELLRTLEGQGTRLRQAISTLGRQHRQNLTHLVARLRHPRETLGQFQQLLDDRSERLEQAISRLQQQRQSRLETAAARLSPLHVNQRLGQYQQRWQTLLQRLADACGKHQQQQEKRLLACASRLTPYRLQVLHEQAQQRLTHQHTRLSERTSRVLEQNTQRLEKTHRLLESYSYRNTLQRGFALVQAGEGGALVTTQAAAATHPKLTITFADGALPVTVQKP